MKEKQGRIHCLDTLKGLLILCVVLGHFMEVIPGMGIGHPLYRIIYSFHMPAFIWISGFLARPGIKKIGRLAITFFITQIVYQLFVHLVYQGHPLTAFRLSFDKPYWILWYLLVMVYYSCLVPVLELAKGKWEGVIIGGSILLALGVGYIPTIGYNLSLSRFFVFFPFFITGYYMARHKESIYAAFSGLTGKIKWRMLGSGVALMIPAVVFCGWGPVTAQMMYGSYGYALGYNLLIRLLLYIISSLWTFVFLIIVTLPGNRKIPVLSWLGRNTMPIYLTHGFLVKLFAWGIL